MKEISQNLKEVVSTLFISSIGVINKISKIIRILIFCRKGIKYHRSMINLTAHLCLQFPEEESYIFLNMIIKCIYPSKFYSEETGHIVRQNYIRALGEFISVINPSIVKIFDLEEKMKNTEIFDTEDLKNSKYPYNQFIKKIGDLYLVNCFSQSISNELFFKLIDCCLLFGYDFLLKMVFKILEKKTHKINDEVKHCMSGLSPTIENLTIAGTLASSKHLIKFKDKAFKKFLQISINDNYTDKLIAGKKEHFMKIAKASTATNFQKVIEGRMDKLRKLKEAFIISKISMDLNQLEIVFNDIESYSLNENLNKDGKISYLSFIKYMGNPKGKHYWPDHLISTFLIVVDENSRGYITSLELKVILTLLSEDKSEEKLWKICNFFDLNKNFVFELDEAISLIHHLEFILLGENKISKKKENSIVEKLKKAFGADSVNINEFVEIFYQIDELKPLYQLVELTKTLNENKNTSILMDYLNIKQEAFIQNKMKDKLMMTKLLGESSQIERSMSIVSKKDNISDFSSISIEKKKNDESLEIINPEKKEETVKKVENNDKMGNKNEQKYGLISLMKLHQDLV